MGLKEVLNAFMGVKKLKKKNQELLLCVNKL